MQAEEPPLHPMTPDEYAKIQGVLERIEGLRRAMIATVAAGLLSSFLVYVGVHAFLGCLWTCPSNQPPDELVAFIYGASAFIPFVVMAGFLSRKVGRHIDRLSKGKYELPRVIE